MLKKRIFWVFVALGLGYLLVSFVTPPEESALIKYGLSVTEAKILELTIILPVVFIWLIAYYGWDKIQGYSITLGDSKEGRSFGKISKGLLALALYMPVNSILSIIARDIYTDNDHLAAPLVITTNYIGLLILLYAMVQLSRGAFELKSSAKKKQQWKLEKPFMILLAILSFFYVYVTLSNPYRQNPMENGTAAHYLPDWLLSSTIIFPYLIVFYLGFRSVQYLHTYKLSVNGVIYKDALKNIANGVAVSIIAVLGIRYLVSLNSFLDDAALKPLLSIIYLLIIVLAVGFLLIARGAKKLQRIEDI